MREYDCISPTTPLVSPYTFFRCTAVCLLKKNDSIGGSILLYVIKNFTPLLESPIPRVLRPITSKLQGIYPIKICSNVKLVLNLH